MNSFLEALVYLPFNHLTRLLAREHFIELVAVEAITNPNYGFDCYLNNTSKFFWTYSVIANTRMSL